MKRQPQVSEPAGRFTRPDPALKRWAILSGPGGLEMICQRVAVRPYQPVPSQVVGAEAVPTRGAPASGPARTGRGPGHERAGLEFGAPMASPTPTCRSKSDYCAFSKSSTSFFAFFVFL